MNRVRIEFTVERGDDEFDVEIQGSVSTYVPARRYGPPEACYDAEGGEAEILSITRHGAPWTGELTADEEERALDKLGEEYAEQDDEGPDPPEPGDFDF